MRGCGCENSRRHCSPPRPPPQRASRQCTEDGCRGPPVHGAKLLTPPRGPVVFDATLDDVGLDVPAAHARVLEELVYGHVERLRDVFVDQRHDALLGAGPAGAAREPLQAASYQRLPRRRKASPQLEMQGPGTTLRAVLRRSAAAGAPTTTRAHGRTGAARRAAHRARRSLVLRLVAGSGSRPHSFPRGAEHREQKERVGTPMRARHRSQGLLLNPC